MVHTHEKNIRPHLSRNINQDTNRILYFTIRLAKLKALVISGTGKYVVRWPFLIHCQEKYKLAQTFWEKFLKIYQNVY